MARHNNIDYSPNIAISFANISVGNETVSLQDKQKQEVKNLKRDGYPVGTPVGAPAIANILKSKYHENALSERTISRLISDVKFRGLEESYLPSEVSGATRSYAARLSLVKESLMKGHGLSALEAGLTDRVLQEFDDPHGDRVDLISQFSILWELAEREISSDPTQDLEDLFSFAPWNDDSALYKAAIENGVAELPKLRLIMPMIFDNDDALVKLCVGAFAQLNLPFLSMLSMYRMKKSPMYGGIIRASIRCKVLSATTGKLTTWVNTVIGVFRQRAICEDRRWFF